MNRINLFMNRHYRLPYYLFYWCLILVGLVMMFGCAAPKEVATATIAARVDARATAAELSAGYASPTTMPADTLKAVRHFQTVSDLLIPAEAYFRKVSPDKVSK